jgi:ABC-type dipeptide/oligopeptide/nickel transport system permease subunit
MEKILGKIGKVIDLLFDIVDNYPYIVLWIIIVAVFGILIKLI